MENALVCVKHCEKIVCKKGLDVCPKCKRKIKFTEIPPPFYYPCPFVNGHSLDQALSIVVKPTSGSWGEACKSNDDLHIGVTDANGNVVSYHWQGIMLDTNSWESVIVVYAIAPDMLVQCEYRWAKFINEMSPDGKWCPRRYDEHSHNCLDFVLAFLAKLYSEVTELYGTECLAELSFLASLNTKKLRQWFSDTFVARKLDLAIKYNTLFEEVEKCGYASVA